MIKGDMTFIGLVTGAIIISVLGIIFGVGRWV